MTKTTIKRDILDYTGGAPFIHTSQVATMLRIGRDAARALLADMEYIQVGNRKDYAVDDLAAKLASIKRKY